MRGVHILLATQCIYFYIKKVSYHSRIGTAQWLQSLARCYGLQTIRPGSLTQAWQRGTSRLALTSQTIVEGEERGNLANFEAHIKLRSIVFLRCSQGVVVLGGDSPSSNRGLNQHFKVFTKPSTFEADQRAADWHGFIYMVLK